MPPFLEEAIREANAAVFEVVNRVRQARARHIFNATYRDDGPERNEILYAETQALLPAILASLEEADRAVDGSNLPWNRAVGSRRALRGRGNLRGAVGRLRERFGR